MGGWTSWLVVNDSEVRVGKQLWTAKGPNWKAKWQPKIRVCLLFLMGSWRREMVKWMVLMNESQSDCHMSVRQWFSVLGNYNPRPGLIRPTMPAKMREKGPPLLSPYTSHVIGAGLGQSTWTHNRFQLGFTLPSQTFMHRTGFTISFQNIIIDIVVLWLLHRQIFFHIPCREQIILAKF